ncbi:MAG: twin-arginine translocase TatA/TatE family subunit [Polyangia bacterium]
MPGIWEWIIIGLAIVIFFGASKLPKLGKGLGEGIRNFKSGLKGEGKDGDALAESDEPKDGGESEKKEG